MSRNANPWQDIKVILLERDNQDQLIQKETKLIMEINNQKFMISLMANQKVYCQESVYYPNFESIRLSAIKNLLADDDLIVFYLFINSDDYDNLIESRDFDDYEQIPCKKCLIVTNHSKDDWICDKCGDVYCQNCIDECGQQDEETEEWICNSCK